VELTRTEFDLLEALTKRPKLASPQLLPINAAVHSTEIDVHLECRRPRPGLHVGCPNLRVLSMPGNPNEVAGPFKVELLHRCRRRLEL
jgi:hypothetical protein